jgi:hypothetical protein
MTGKLEMKREEQPLIPEHPDSSPKLKFLQDLSISIKAKVAKEVLNYVSQ